MKCNNSATRRYGSPLFMHSRNVALSGYAVALLIALALAPAPAPADTLQALTVAPGYQAHPIELGVPFGGAMAVDPANPDRLFVSAGNYGEQTVLTVNVDTGATRTLSPVIGNIGGLAVLGNGDLAITENLTTDTILRARDLNADGEFSSPGEITELIAPILADSSFTGAQLAVAPPNNVARIPAGALVVQTADGGTSAELLVVKNPVSSPAYFPPGDAWFSGFTYNGGIAFTPAGDLLCGISEFPTGRVLALINADQNSEIDPSEEHEILGGDALTNSLSDIAVTGDNRLITTENSGSVRWFDLPGDLSEGAIHTSGVLVQTNASYLSTVRVDSRQRSFSPGAALRPATIYVGGFVTFPAATNLLAITPESLPAAARDWALFR